MTDDFNDNDDALDWPDLSDWGGWLLNPAKFSLDRIDVSYWVELDTCTTPAEVLDWIAQINGKSWANDQVLAGLVRALDDILNLQANLCSEGRARTLSKQEIRDKIAAMAKTSPARLVPA